jgi:glycosyltransferase involved in cell wall biosynthesis
MQEKHCRLSVLLVTYNHENYLRQALHALFEQQFHGPIELVIADDSSSDRTVDIIREHEGKDSRFRFKYLDDTSHLGTTRNYQRGFAACTGDYVAILEGDDYWVSPVKLLRQYDFLEAHWECDLCAVNYFMYEQDEARFTPLAVIGNGHQHFGARDMIAGNPVGNFSVCMYRRSALDALPQHLFELESYDWIVNICVARTSLIGFLEEPMSVYRRHTGGVWTQKSDIAKLNSQLHQIPAYDALTDHQFHEEFDALARRLQHGIRVATAAQVGHVDDPVVRLLMQALPRLPNLSDYVPPVLMAAGRALVPVVVQRRLVRMVQGRRVT